MPGEVSHVRGNGFTRSEGTVSLAKSEATAKAETK